MTGQGYSDRGHGGVPGPGGVPAQRARQVGMLGGALGGYREQAICTE